MKRKENKNKEERRETTVKEKKIRGGNETNVKRKKVSK